MSDLISEKARKNIKSSRTKTSALNQHDAEYVEVLNQPKHAQPNDRFSILEFSSSQTTVHSSPLPSVEEFAGYETVHKGAAGRILAMAESEQKHQQWMEKSYRLFDFFLRLAGLFLVAALVAGLMFVTYQAATTGYPVLSGFFGAGGIVAIGGTLRHYLLQQKPSASDPRVRERKPRKS